VSFEPKIMSSQETNPNQIGLSSVIPHEAYRSSRVSRPPKWYDFIVEEIYEVFMYGDSD